MASFNMEVEIFEAAPDIGGRIKVLPPDLDKAPATRVPIDLGASRFYNVGQFKEANHVDATSAGLLESVAWLAGNDAAGEKLPQLNRVRVVDKYGRLAHIEGGKMRSWTR